MLAHQSDVGLPPGLFPSSGRYHSSRYSAKVDPYPTEVHLVGDSEAQADPIPRQIDWLLLGVPELFFYVPLYTTAHRIPPSRPLQAPTVLDFPQHASEQDGDPWRRAYCHNVRVIHAAFTSRMPPRICLCALVSSSG